MTTLDGFHLAPEVEYAVIYLQRHGEVFGISFRLDNAVSKAAEMVTVWLDEELDWENVKKMTRLGIPFEDWT